MLALDQFFLCFLSQRCWKANLHHEVFFTCLPKKRLEQKVCSALNTNTLYFQTSCDSYLFVFIR